MEILRIIFFLILSFTGIFGLFAGLKADQFRRKVLQWLTASLGEINTSLIEPESALKESPAVRTTLVSYFFILNGNRISGNNKANAFQLLVHRQAHLNIQAEKKRKKLNECNLVYYNPENPEENFLIMASFGRVMLIIISGILLFLFSFIAFLITLAEQLT